ncbi:nitroreductase family protein [Marinagarivorans algicola]|uniref:nitroreductase family protein n=1 Tax=Marinagarivorans algicola TaxID=1513270 RepID=UPI0006B8D9D3|nr:nitroreductase [Marinagarivorans algicola]
MTTLELLHSRRSVKAADMVAPGPNAQDIQDILQAAHRVPDHGKIGPWRFIVFNEGARQLFGQTLKDIYAAQNPEASAKLLEHQQNLFLRAPVVIAVIASPDRAHKVPEWEQHLAVGAACQNLLIATHALGYVGQWLTQWYSYNDEVNQALKLAPHERIAGFMYLGSATQAPTERERPDLSERITHFPTS